MDAVQYLIAAPETSLVVWLLGFVSAVLVGGTLALVATRA